MPDLKWNEIDFLDFFEVEPLTNDYCTFYTYEVQRSLFRLLFTIWPMESVGRVSLFHEDRKTPLLNIAAYIRGEARLIKEPLNRRLDLEDCIIAPSRFWYIQAGNLFDRSKFPVSVTLSLALDPDLMIDLDDFQSRT